MTDFDDAFGGGRTGTVPARFAPEVLKHVISIYGLSTRYTVAASACLGWFILDIGAARPGLT
jgi:hypothetical protein